MARDDLSEKLNIWHYIYSGFVDVKYLKLMFTTQEWICIGSIAKGYITKHLALVYEVATAFIILC